MRSARQRWQQVAPLQLERERRLSAAEHRVSGPCRTHARSGRSGRSICSSGSADCAPWADGEHQASYQARPADCPFLARCRRAAPLRRWILQRHRRPSCRVRAAAAAHCACTCYKVYRPTSVAMAAAGGERLRRRHPLLGHPGTRGCAHHHGQGIGRVLAAAEQRHLLALQGKDDRLGSVGLLGTVAPRLLFAAPAGAVAVDDARLSVTQGTGGSTAQSVAASLGARGLRILHGCPSAAPAVAAAVEGGEAPAAARSATSR